MVDIVCLVGLLLLLIGLFIARYIFETTSGPSQWWLRRLPTISGLVVIAGGVLVLPWLEFAPWQYLGLPDIILGFLPDVFEYLSENIKYLDWLAYLNPLFDLRFNGLVTAMILAPTTSSFITRFIILLPLWVFVLFGLWSIANYLLGSSTVLRGKVQAASAALVALLLLFQIPAIDAWGATGDVNQGLVAVVSGARISWGVWVTLFGLLLLALGGLIEMNDQDSQGDIYDDPTF